jgi:L-ascorbate metabolism protein UlaG (beta-lactamase superfamily)
MGSTANEEGRARAMEAEMSSDSITFGGTATTVIRLGAFTVLTDPNFLHQGQRAYLGKGLWSRRLTEPAILPRDLPPLDAIVLSHLHGDHFDRIARRTLDKSVPLVTTPQAAGRLRRYGFAATGLPVWDARELKHGNETLTIEALPGLHARGVLRALLPPVMGSLLVYRIDGKVRRTLYLSGDTLTGDHLDEIHRRHPQIDAAVVHLGGTRILFSTVTMDAAQGLDFLRRIRPRVAVPVHYDDYRVMKSPLSDFLDATSADEEVWRVTAPTRGETIQLADVLGPA